MTSTETEPATPAALRDDRERHGAEREAEAREAGTAGADVAARDVIGAEAPEAGATGVTDDEAAELWGRVIDGFVSTNRRVHAAVRTAFALGEAEAETLLTLRRVRRNRAPMAALARAASFTSGGYTKVADKLVRRGLVRRVPCENDRRITYLELTAEGGRVAADLLRLVADVSRERFFSVLGPERARLVAEAMAELHRANRDRDRGRD